MIRHLFITALFAILAALALPAPVSAASDTATRATAGSTLILSGTVVLDTNCDGRLDGELRVKGKVSVQIVDLRTGQVVTTVAVKKGRWTVAVPIEGEYGVTIPMWISRQGYSPSPAGQSILKAPYYTSAALSSLTPVGPIGLCRTTR